MGNGTTPDTTLSHKSTVVIAAVLPGVFAVVLAILVIALFSAFLVPRVAGDWSLDSRSGGGRRETRLGKLERSVRAQHFRDWAAKQRRDHPNAAYTLNPLCVICLDQIEDTAQIRGLECLHVFHRECLDDWFSRWNEYCPLCHRPIIRGTRAIRADPPAVAFMV